LKVPLKIAEFKAPCFHRPVAIHRKIKGFAELGWAAGLKAQKNRNFAIICKQLLRYTP
jgi:hypothetical protein